MGVSAAKPMQLLCFSLGGVVWAGDFLGCQQLGFLQLHVFWHLFSALAGHYALQYYLYCRLAFRGAKVAVLSRSGLTFVTAAAIAGDRATTVPGTAEVFRLTAHCVAVMLISTAALYPELLL